MALCNESERKMKSELLDNLLLEYSGHALDLEKLSDYDRDSMAYFTDSKTTRQPRLHISFDFDVTSIHSAFLHKAEINDTFTGYLTWGLIAAIRLHPYLSWRYIDGAWYTFEDLPLFIPVATGLLDNRFVSVTLKHVTTADRMSFSKRYKSAIEQALCDQSKVFGDQLHWSNYHFIGNLPNLQFTGLMLHESGFETARPIFYFGRRYWKGDKYLTPLAIQFHHATFDPVRLSNFLADFNKVLTQ